MLRRSIVAPILALVLAAVGIAVLLGSSIGGPVAVTSPAPSSSGQAGTTSGGGSTVTPEATSSPTAATPTAPVSAGGSPAAPGTAKPTASPTPASSPAGSSTALDPAMAGRLQRSLDRYAKRYRLPGASVTITWPDGRHWTGSTGFADVAARRAVTADTAFSIASMSKTFTAALVLKLVEEGRVQLDTPVANLLPDVRIGTPGRRIPKAITIRMLLDHTSGLADFFFGKGVDKALLADRGATWTAARALSFVGPQLFPPGKGWHYSNTNYLLLGLVAEWVGPASFADQVRSKLLDPLHLRRAFVQPDERPRGPLSVGYYFNSSAAAARPIPLADKAGKVAPFTSVVTAAGSAGDLAATTSDLAAWARAIYGGTVLQPATLAAAVADARKTARFHPIVPYGLGVQVTKIGGRTALGHSGRLLGTRGELRYLPAAGVAIAVLANQNGVDLRPLTASLLKIALPPASTPSPSP